MEKNIAILIADLSGYTALTETHGASAAADTIDRFMKIVSESLVGKSEFHQRVGDEVVIVSPSPDQLIETSIRLMQLCSLENNFLQLHGGLHYGNILQRSNSYFGTTINMASRIAGKANKGTVWCSEEFVNALEAKNQFTFRSRGSHQFKNISVEKEMFELQIEHAHSFSIDPVCRMRVHDNKAVLHHSNDILFCSSYCRDIYIGNNKNTSVISATRQW